MLGVEIASFLTIGAVLSILRVVMGDGLDTTWRTIAAGVLGSLGGGALGLALLPSATYAHYNIAAVVFSAALSMLLLVADRFEATHHRVSRG